MEKKENKTANWFLILSGILFLWNLMGVAAFFMQISITDEAIQGFSATERELYNNYSLWTKLVFALAVFGGSLGTLGLLLRKKWSKPVLIVSLLAVIVQMSHSLFIAGAIAVYGSSAAIMPAVTVSISGFLVLFASYGIKQGWLK